MNPFTPQRIKFAEFHIKKTTVLIETQYLVYLGSTRYTPLLSVIGGSRACKTCNLD